MALAPVLCEFTSHMLLAGHPTCRNGSVSPLWGCHSSRSGQCPFCFRWLWFAFCFEVTDPAHWASWADSLRMIHRRHPAVANIMIEHLIEPRGLRHFSAAVACADELLDIGCNPPDWRPLGTAQPGSWQHVSKGCCRHQHRGGSMKLHSRSRASTCGLILICSGSSSASLTFASSSVFTHLPVWPSSRLPWPSPRKLLEGRGTGHALESAAARFAEKLARESPPTSAARAFASSLLDRRGHPGVDDDLPTEPDVFGDFCRAPIAVV